MWVKISLYPGKYVKKEPHQGIQHEIVNSGTKIKIVEVS